MTNEELIRSYANGETWGRANNLRISQDILYSYAMPIAKRQQDGSFTISNRTRALGGEPVSQTTSCHIGLAYSLCSPIAILVPVVD